MDIANLQAFLAVAAAGSFSNAAEQLFLTQPAISKRVSQLETELGVKLFDRIGRSIKLTEAGVSLQRRATNILMDLEDAKREISNLSHIVAGKIVLGTSHHIALHRLSPLLKHFNQTYPQVELDLRFLDSERISALVERGEIELGIITLPNSEQSPLHTIPIWKDELQIVCGQTHPLASKHDIDLPYLLQHPVILPDARTYTRAIIEASFGITSDQFNERLVTNNLETIRVLVEAGLGWSILPKTLITDSLVMLQAGKLRLSRNLGLVLHKGRSLSHAAQVMIEIIKSDMDSTPLDD